MTWIVAGALVMMFTAGFVGAFDLATYIGVLYLILAREVDAS